jgi:hypothetical protein
MAAVVGVTAADLVARVVDGVCGAEAASAAPATKNP